MTFGPPFPQEGVETACNSIGANGAERKSSLTITADKLGFMADFYWPMGSCGQVTWVGQRAGINETRQDGIRMFFFFDYFYFWDSHDSFMRLDVFIG